MNSRIVFGCLLAFVVACGALVAQRDGAIRIPKVERATVLDDKGLKQWAEFEAKECPKCLGTTTHECEHCKELEHGKECLECDFTRRSVCRLCAGSGKTYDPLEWAVCPGCMGGTVFPCLLCLNEGDLAVNGLKGRRRCESCKKAGGFKCSVCKGKRRVRGLVLKPNLSRASLRALTAAKANVEKSLQMLKDFTPSTNTNKDLKAYEQALAPVGRELPAMRQAKTMVSTVLKAMSKGDHWTQNATRKASGFQRFSIYHQVYLMHQLQVLDLCIARAEFNQKASKKLIP